MRTRAPGGLRRVGGIVSAGLVAMLATTMAVIVTRDAAAVAPPFNYGEALQKAIWFYDAQRLGDLPASNRVSWRGDSFLTDGADAGLDLTGGFADAGDHIKATFPMAHSMTTLAWGMVEYPDAYAGTGQASALLSNLRWGMDWLIKAHPSANRLVAEVGDPNTDHQLWASAEVQTYTRQTWFIDASCGGSDLAAAAAAAFAASSMVFRASDPTYATTLLTHARQLYTFADTVRRKYSDCVPVISSFYNSWSGYNDELVWGAIWLSRATSGTESSTFLTKARTLYANLNREGQSSLPVYKWTYDWDDKAVASEVLLAKLTVSPTTPPTTRPPTSTPTQTSPPGTSGCQVTYAITNQWSTGFGSTVTIANTGTATINGWTLSFTFPGNQRITQLWNAGYTTSGAAVVATNLSYNAAIAPGASTAFGFNGSYSGTNNKPTAFTVNGQACAMG